MRIITGKYKGRHFDIPRSFKARPTTDFAKENIFNVLTGYLDFEGATALDLFSGTGSITLELLSRGCSQVISIESDRDHHRFICDCLKIIDGNATPLRADAFRFIKSCHTQFDFIFADPPYALKELPTIPDLIFEKQLLKPNAIFVFEHGKDNDFAQHPHFVEHRSYGSVNFSIFR
ncbi:MAG: RsmD family RNA methyltransferase [Prevotella sp.]|nr:RsmD family RNA methyltransferase [Prevotella sp.]